MNLEGPTVEGRLEDLCGKAKTRSTAAARGHEDLGEGWPLGKVRCFCVMNNQFNSLSEEFPY